MVGVLLLSACGTKTVTCPSAGSYSECNENGVKTRTNYRLIDSETCQGYAEEMQCATEVRVTGRTGLTEMRITPTIEKKR